MSGCTEDSSAKVPPFGQMTWLEVPVSDAARAGRFYTDVLGWECSPKSMPRPVDASGYKEIYFFSKGGLNGAFLLMEDGCQILNSDAADSRKCAVTTTFCVESIEDTLAKVDKAGGKVHVGKTDIGGGMGVFCRFIDSEGNMMGAWAKE